MSYSKQTWVNGSSKLNQTRLNHIEDGIEATAIVADDAIPAPASPSDDMALIYDTTTGAWTAARVPEAAFASGKIFAPSKIQQDGASIGQALLWDGSDWAPGDLAPGTPTGVVAPFAGSSSPSGWLLCDGTAVSRTTYADLFDEIGTVYGTGDGSTTFNVPDLQGRMVVGKGTHADVDTLGESDGSALANRRPKHKHTVGGSIAHNTGGNVGPQAAAAGGGTGGNAITDITGIQIGPQTNVPTDAPAYLVLNYIIKT